MPREWPPVSVWLLGGTFVAPAVGLFVLFPPPIGLWWKLVALIVAAAVLVWAGLIAGREFAFVAWVVTAILVGGQVMVSLIVACVAVARLSSAGGPSLDDAVALGMLAAGGSAVALLGWPETRRWCGLTPPAEPEADE